MIRHRQLETSAAEFLPKERDLASLRFAAASCRGCELHRQATQTVFGEGPAEARLVFVGEQPGSDEDRAGRPYVGPASKLFDAVLEDVGIDRSQIYLTNVVKHFKPTLRGRKRLSAKATFGEVRACLPWLEAELATICPEIVVCLGAVAAQALLGTTFRVSKQHGQVFATAWAPWTIATFHPTAILRAPDAIRADVHQAFVADMKRVAERLRAISRV